MNKDYFKIAFNNLIERRTRSILTLLGIFMAVITIFVLLSLSIGLNDYVGEQFEMLGTDKFFIMPKGQLGATGEGGAVELTIEDVEVVEKVNGISKISYAAYATAKIEYKEKSRYYMVIGMPTDKSEYIDMFFETANLEMDEGRIPEKTDRHKIIMGYNYKYKNLFDKPVKTKDTVEINDVEFEVIGIVGKIGNPADDQQVYISYEDFQELYDSGDRVDYIYAQIKSGEDLKEVADRTKRKLMGFRNVDEESIDFTVSTPEDLLETFGVILNILTVFLVGIGSISLIVGGVGIANTMYTSVLERRKEIGTMKAIGARNSDILYIFMIEAGLLGLVGGALGVLFGIIISKSIEYIAAVYLGSKMIQASMSLFLIIGSLFFAFVIGIVSGFAPSYQASRLKPVDTLRYE